jgi:scyllo-inositol 2-dehydrogenase (NADP+)
MKSSQPLKTALAGFGTAAKVMHAPFLAVNKNFDVQNVLERHADDSKKIFPKAKIVKSFEELLKKDDELIIITTPNETHFEYAKKALEAGKNVVLEKPFTITSDEALELIKLAKETGKILSVFQNRRYASDFLTIKEILDKKLLGQVHSFEAHFDRYRPEPKPGKAWREQALPGSGIVYDLGSHLIDQALCLFGMPLQIFAEIKKQRSFAVVDDCFEIHLYYASLEVTLKASMLIFEPGPKYLIHGTEGSFIKYGEDPQEEKLKTGSLPDEKKWGQEDEKFDGELQSKTFKGKYHSLRGNFGSYYENLYESIVNKAPLKEKAGHGYNTIRLIELAFESNEKKKVLACDKLLDINY